MNKEEAKKMGKSVASGVKIVLKETTVVVFSTLRFLSEAVLALVDSSDDDNKPSNTTSRKK